MVFIKIKRKKRIEIWDCEWGAEKQERLKKISCETYLKSHDLENVLSVSTKSLVSSFLFAMKK